MRDGELHGVVDVPVRDQVVGVAVVGDQHAPLLRGRRDGREEVDQVAGEGPLADHHVHSQPQLLQGFRGRPALVVAHHPGGVVCSQLLARKVRSVPVNDLGVQGELGHDPVVGGHDARIIHHLAHPEDAPFADEPPEVDAAERGA
jgi:hypothetical protein